MKFFSSLISPAIFVLITSCSSGSKQAATAEYSGIIEPTGISTYQYGSHTLKTRDTFYALKSEAIKLEQFEGRSVTIKAKRIEGYPIEGGPEFLEVLQVSEY